MGFCQGPDVIYDYFDSNNQKSNYAQIFYEISGGKKKKKGSTSLPSGAISAPMIPNVA